MVASFRNKIKKHVPKIALHSIRSLIVGNYKSGKTRLWKEVTELHYDNPAEETLLIAFEKGYETWQLESVLPIHEEGEPWQVWEYFRNQVVKGLVAEAKEDKTLKLIGIDTADKAIDAATAWILREQGRKYGKVFTSLQEVTESTDGNGYTLLADEMNKQFDALENAGYGIMSLAWTKEKETTLYNGLKYNSLELMMSNTGRKVFESQASLICTLFNEVKVYDKDGNELDENLRDKKGRERASNFHSTRVVMVFRPNEYVSIGGGRYVNLPEEPVEYSAEKFLEVYENAVKGQLKNTSKTVEEIKQEQEEAIEEKAKAYAEKVEQEVTVEDLIEQITKETERFQRTTINKVIVPRFKEIFDGTADYRKIDNVEQLSAALEYIKSVDGDA